MSHYESNKFLTSCTSTPLYPIQLNRDVRILILIFIDSMIPIKLLLVIVDGGNRGTMKTRKRSELINLQRTEIADSKR